MFWKWLEWQIEISCDEGWWNAETEFYLCVHAGLSLPWQEWRRE